MHIIYYPGCVTENCLATCSTEAEIIYELRPCVSKDFLHLIDPALVAKIWIIRFSNKRSTHELLQLNQNSRIVTSKGETYEFQDFPKLAMKLEMINLENTLEAL